MPDVMGLDVMRRAVGIGIGIGFWVQGIGRIGMLRG